MSSISSRQIMQGLTAATIPARRMPTGYCGSCLAAGLIFLISMAPAYAETCRKQIVNGQEVIICCDGNGVCYRQ